MLEKNIFLKELKDLLIAHFGDDIKNVVLFGSQARGDAQKNSDYDVLIIFNRDYNWRREDEITSLLYEMELKYEIFIDTKVISIDEMHGALKGKDPLYVDAIREGIYACP